MRGSSIEANHPLIMVSNINNPSVDDNASNEPTSDNVAAKVVANRMHLRKNFANNIKTDNSSTRLGTSHVSNRNSMADMSKGGLVSNGHEQRRKLQTRDGIGQRTRRN